MLITDSTQYAHSTHAHIQAFSSKQASHLYQYVYTYIFDSISLTKVMHHCNKKKVIFTY